MKILIVLACFGAFTSAKLSSKKEMYFFCVSHSKDASTQSVKESVLITPVKFLVAEEEYTKILSRAWQDTVQKNCSNTIGCTSDFNYYFDEKSAKEQLDKTQKKYSDTSRYSIKTIDFKAK